MLKIGAIYIVREVDLKKVPMTDLVTYYNRETGETLIEFPTHANAVSAVSAVRKIIRENVGNFELAQQTTEDMSRQNKRKQ